MAGWIADANSIADILAQRTVDPGTDLMTIVKSSIILHGGGSFPNSMTGRGGWWAKFLSLVPAYSGGALTGPVVINPDPDADP